MRNRLFILVCVTFLVSCVNDKDYELGDVTLSPEMAIPLAFGDIGLVDLVTRRDSAFIKSYPDGLLYFYYTQTKDSPGIHDLFSLPNNDFSTSFNLPVGTLPASSTDVAVGSLNGQIDLGLSPEQLTEVLLKTGSLNYSLDLSRNTNPPNLSVEAVVTLTDVIQKETLQSLAFTAPVGSGSKPLQDYVIQMINNRFNIRVDLVIKPHPVTFIPAGTQANLQMHFVDMDFAHIKGFLGDQTAQIPTEIMELSVFSSTLRGADVSLVQPRLTMQVVNDHGVPCEIDFTTLRAVKTGGTLPFQLSPSGPINLNVPSALGMSATTEINILNQQALLNFSPQQLEYGSTVRINKGLSGGTNFLSDTSKLRVILTSEIPIYGRVSNITVIDTLHIDFGELDGSKVNTASLKINAHNEMPLDVNLQIYLADENYLVIDSVFSPNQTYIIKASSVDASGDLLTAGVTDLKISLDPLKLSKLFDSRYMILKAKMNSAEDQNGTPLNVKFKSSYRLALDVGMLARINITLK